MDTLIRPQGVGPRQRKPKKQKADVGERWLKQLLIALVFAHGCGLAHMDVHDGNLFLDARNNAFLGDFGFSIVATPQAIVIREQRPHSPCWMRTSRLSEKLPLAIALSECILEHRTGSSSGQARNVWSAAKCARHR